MPEEEIKVIKDWINSDPNILKGVCVGLAGMFKTEPRKIYLNPEELKKYPGCDLDGDVLPDGTIIFFDFDAGIWNERKDRLC